MVRGNESLVFEQYSEKQLRIVIGFLQLGVSCSAQDTQTLQTGRITEKTFGSNTSYGPPHIGDFPTIYRVNYCYLQGIYLRLSC